MNWLTVAGCVLASLAAGCGGDDFSGPNMQGELGAGAFLYICVGDSDPYCDGATVSSFPEVLAVGGSFDLEYEADDDVFEDDALPQVIAASPQSIGAVGMGFAMLRPGHAAVLATTGVGEVYDLRHLYAADVARVAFTTGDSQELADVSLEVGEQLTIRAQPQDSLRTTLGGSLTYEWVSDDAEVVRIATADVDRDVTIEGVATGVTMIRVNAGGFVQALTVEVGGAVATSNAEDSGASDDGTSGTEGDATEGSSGTSDSTDAGESGSTSDDTGTTGDN
jgi:hypothetical protein